MKKISTAVLFISLLLAYPLSSRAALDETKPSKSAREWMNLLGPVQTIRSEWCVVSKTPNESSEYNELEHTRAEALTFDRSGKLISGESPRYICGGFLAQASERHSQKYDENGNVVEDIVTGLNGSLLRTVVQAFDSAGNRTEVAYYYPDGANDFRWLTKFDKNGNEIEAILFGQGGVYQFKEVRTYNPRGQWTEYVRYGPDGSVRETLRQEFEYDSYGNWTKSIRSEFATKDGESFFKPIRIDYRFITYFTEN